MLVVPVLLSLLLPEYQCSGFADLQYTNPRPRLTECLGDIIRKYFKDARTVSYFSLGSQDDILLYHLHSLKILGVHLCKPSEPSLAVIPNSIEIWKSMKSCVIVSRNEDEFAEQVGTISKQRYWNPYVRFLVVLDTLRATNLRKVFDSLLLLHINHVIVVNATETGELYTYNPFENYACGKYYQKINKWGKCADVNSTDIYPEKIVTGLRNCFFNVSCAHWPPYAIQPEKSDDSTYVMGTEQYIFDIMSQIEKFNYVFTYNYDPEMFSTVSDDMTVSGPLTLIQSNHTDMIMGGLMLIQSRAKSFLYIHGHLDQVDEIRIMVRKALYTPPWKNFYVEFSPLVWSLLLLVLVVYAILLMILLRKTDKGRIFLLLLDNLLLHSSKIHSRQTVNLTIIIWVWFAYLINCFYTSSLVSLTMMPSTEYQIKEEADLKEYGLKPCVSTFMKTFMKGEFNYIDPYPNYTNDGSCDRLLSSVKTVSQSENRFTFVLYNVYLFYKQLLYDEYGQPPVYSFKKPYSKVVYAIYMYKGFPMEERLHELALRIRETGLSEKNLKDHFFRKNIRYQFQTRGRETRFAIPWGIYIVGVSLSSVTFLVEVASKARYKKVNWFSTGLYSDRQM